MAAGINGDYTQRAYLRHPEQAAVRERVVDTGKQTSDEYIKDGCTDGSDDGSLGIGEIGENLLKGAGNTVVNAVKSCFTDENGNFSVTRTLFTAGAAALCIAVPPLGLAACALGVGAGTAQTLKGAYNFAVADTDKEAKEALQNVTGGIVTAGVSALGTKASFGAMKQGAKLENGASAIVKLQNRRSNTSLPEVAKAWKTDMWGSAKNGVKGLWDDVTTKAGNAIDYTPNLIEKAGKGIDSVLHSLDKAHTAFFRAKNRSAKSNIKHAGQTVGKAAQNIPSSVKSAVKKVRNAKNNVVDLYKNVTSENSAYAQDVSKYGYKKASDTLKVFAGEQIS